MSNSVDTLIEKHLIDQIPGFCDEHSELCQSVILTGSYARKTHDQKQTNVNVYFISQSNNSPELRIELGLFFQNVRRNIMKEGYEFEVDCHPFSVVTREIPLSTLPRVVLTSKVLDANYLDKRLSLPPTIGLGWLKAYKILWGDIDLKQVLGIDIQKTDENWYQAVHEALCRYKGIMDHLPWVFDWQTEPKLLAIESLRYAEEVIRDALPVALTESELNMDYQFNLYHHWKNGTSEFLEERYGELGSWMNDTVMEIKEHLSTQDYQWNEESAIYVWKAALQVWQIVWDKFVERVSQEFPGKTWLTRVNAFV